MQNLKLAVIFFYSSLIFNRRLYTGASFAFAYWRH